MAPVAPVAPAEWYYRANFLMFTRLYFATAQAWAAMNAAGLIDFIRLQGPQPIFPPLLS
jgi:hypothetical protein